MKFASLLATLSLAVSTFAVYVNSADGTQIWAEATGNPKNPAVVFIPGFSCTSLAFDKQWYDPYMLANLYMVRQLLNHYCRSCSISYLTFNRFGMMFAVRRTVDNRSPQTLILLNTGPMTLKPSLIISTSETRGQFWPDGAQRPRPPTE